MKAHEHQWSKGRGNIETCSIPGCARFRGLGEPIISESSWPQCPCGHSDRAHGRYGCTQVTVPERVGDGTWQ